MYIVKLETLSTPCNNVSDHNLLTNNILNSYIVNFLIYTTKANELKSKFENFKMNEIKNE